MANKRNFKKVVEAIGASVCEPMMAYYYTADDENRQKVEKLIAKVLGAVGAASANADITFDKGVKAFDSLKEYSKAKKDFFKKLFEKINNDFTKEIDESLKEFNALLPDEVKAANKNAAV